MLIAIVCPHCQHRGLTSTELLPRSLRCCGVASWMTITQPDGSRRARRVRDEAEARRWAAYDSVICELALVINPELSSTGNPAATLLLHLFECVTGKTARGHMLKLYALTPQITGYVSDHIEFVRTDRSSASSGDFGQWSISRVRRR
jgi:hypothetical protein